MPKITEAKPKLLSPEGLAKLPKERKDWLGVFGNTWGTRRHDAGPLTGEEKQALADALNPFAEEWFCGWCRRKLHRPAENELIICPDCGSQGAITVQMEKRNAQAAREAAERVDAEFDAFLNALK